MARPAAPPFSRPFSFRAAPTWEARRRRRRGDAAGRSGRLLDDAFFFGDAFPRSLSFLTERQHGRRVRRRPSSQAKPIRRSTGDPTRRQGWRGQHRVRRRRGEARRHGRGRRCPHMPVVFVNFHTRAHRLRWEGARQGLPLPATTAATGQQESLTSLASRRTSGSPFSRTTRPTRRPPPRRWRRRLFDDRGFRI